MATLQELGTVRLQLRLGGEDYQKALHAVQGDTGRVIEFDVLDGSGTVVTDLTGVTPTLFVRRPDGKEVGSATGEIVGGVIRITIPSSLLAYAGETKAQIQLVDSANQHKLHDHLYRLQIEESLEAGASPGENLWFSLAELTEAIAEVNLLVEQYDNDVAAVSTMRTEVQTNRDYVAGVYTQMSNVIASENARVTAENERKTAETERASAETARATAESTRVSQENTRKSSEVDRGQAEATRVSQESARVTAETARASAESGRTTAESGRVTAEGSRTTLYNQMKSLNDTLGANPTVQLREDVNALSPLEIFAGSDDEGFLLKTDIPSWNQMIFGEIGMNSFADSAYRKYTLQGFVNHGSFQYTRLWSESQAPLEISLYVIDGFMHVWLPKTRAYSTYYVTIRTINQRYSKNRIVSHTAQGKPTTSTIAIDLASSMSILPATPTVDGLYPKEHFAKVAAIPASPKYTDTTTTINGKTGAITKSDITALGIPAQDTVYTHPANHPASMITQDTSRRMVSDAQIANWDDKASGNHTHDSVQTAQNTALKFSRLTQAAYNALGTKDPSTLYIIVG